MNRIVFLASLGVLLFAVATHAQITFDGGHGDGFDGASAARENAPTWNSAIFKGGDADGFAFASDRDASQPVLNSAIFKGGDADGFAIKNIGNPTPVPLPLQVLRFEGSARPDHNRITWAVADLENPETRFILERSTAVSGQYYALDTLTPSAAQRQQESSEFLYRDHKLKAGINQYIYRLKEMSPEKQRYYGPIFLHRDAPQNVRITLFPNPLPKGQNARLKLEGLSPGNYQLLVRATTGQVVFRKELHISKSSSSYLFQRPREAAQGRYSLEITNSQGFQEELQLILE